ncbi:MAG: glycerate kinase [Propionibacteriaceae bacterium]
MRVLIAPDKFKGCLTAAQVAACLADGMLSARPSLQVTQFPIADGGDGTVAAALTRGYVEVPLWATGPSGQPLDTGYALRGQRAVIELAMVCGLDRLPAGRLDPLGASTYGLGEVIKHAITGGATEIVIALGGSASTDGGAGMLEALGARLLDDSGAPIGRGGAALAQLATIDLSELRRTVAGVSFVLASDVENPLLGASGAAAVFGPQKGAGVQELERLEAGLTHWSELVAAAVGSDHSARPGAGAAGGTGFAALAVLDPEVRSGAELVLELLDFATALAEADLVITGEGSLDLQSLAGKGPIGVARAASAADVPAIAVVGHTQLGFDQIRSAGLSAVYPLSDLQPDQRRSIAEAGPLLRSIGSRIAFKWCDPARPRRS